MGKDLCIVGGITALSLAAYCTYCTKESRILILACLLFTEKLVVL